MLPDEIIEKQLRAQIEAKTQDVYAQHSAGDPNLCTSLRRAATSVLIDAKAHDLIKNFTVNCEPGKNSDDPPVVVIQIEFFKRVRQVRFNLE